MHGIFMASLGCSKNLVEAEMMLGETLGDTFTLVLDPYDADFIIINTCGFIEEARNEGRTVIDEYLLVKRHSPKRPRVIATGCWAERMPKELWEEFPELDAVWGISTPHDMGKRLRKLANKPERKPSGIGVPRTVAEGARLITTLPSYAYLKIADGCDNRCHYCAIPVIRGGLRSRRVEAILDEARSLADQDVGELVVISQDTTAYGMDLKMANGLARLLEKLLAAVDVPRIRVLYAHPAHLDDEVIRLLLTEERLCRYLDLPVQHVTDKMLEAMGRHYDRKRVDDILQRFPADFTLRTTMLVGFPGEDDGDFKQMVEFVRQGRFHQLGCFAYSSEDGTQARHFAYQVRPEKAEQRRQIIMTEQRKVAFNWLDSRVGGTEHILVDGNTADGWLIGRSRHEAPDADGAVYFSDESGIEPGAFIDACIKARDGYDLLAVPDGWEVQPGSRFQSGRIARRH